MHLYTPAERRIFQRLIEAHKAARLPVRALQVFGSRARVHSDEDSDLEILGKH